MKTILSLVALCATSLLFSGCQKLIDKYLPTHGPGGGNHQQECRIATVRFENAVEYKVHYDANGNPDSIGHGSNDPSGLSPLVFKYNVQHQLTEYYWGGINEQSVTMHHWYTWQSGRIVKDSSRFISILATDFLVARPTYDNAGRVIRDTIDEISTNEGDQFVRHYANTYTYGADGNLVAFYRTGDQQPTTEAIPYDNKVSYLRTNAVWMFITRNYSTNNQVGATSYNSNGLPLGFATARAGVSGFLDQARPEAFTYDCP